MEKTGIERTVIEEEELGTEEHRAKIRGFRIGQQLLDEADQAGVQVVLNATVMGLYQDKELVVRNSQWEMACRRKKAAERKDMSKINDRT